MIAPDAAAKFAVRQLADKHGVPVPEMLEYVLWHGLAAIEGKPIQSGIHRRVGTTELVRNILRSRYPNGQVPLGVQRRLSVELGCHPVLVGQAMKSLGYEVVR